MISGWLLQAYCPDNGECVEGAGGRRLLAALTGGLAGGAGGPAAECDGRTLWGIVGVLTLSSPLAILLTQVGKGLGSSARNPPARWWGSRGVLQPV